MNLPPKPENEIFNEFFNELSIEDLYHMIGEIKYVTKDYKRLYDKLRELKNKHGSDEMLNLEKDLEHRIEQKQKQLGLIIKYLNEHGFTTKENRRNR